MKKSKVLATGWISKQFTDYKKTGYFSVYKDRYHDESEEIKVHIIRAESKRKTK